jgi:hypothetical protein
MERRLRIHGIRGYLCKSGPWQSETAAKTQCVRRHIISPHTRDVCLWWRYTTSLWRPSSSLTGPQYYQYWAENCTVYNLGLHMSFKASALHYLGKLMIMSKRKYKSCSLLYNLALIRALGERNLFLSCRDNSVGIAPTLWARQLRSRGSIKGRDKRYWLWGPPGLLYNEYWELFLWVKATSTWSWPTHLHPMTRLWLVEVSTLPWVFMAWCLTYQAHA